MGKIPPPLLVLAGSARKPLKNSALTCPDIETPSNSDPHTVILFWRLSADRAGGFRTGTPAVSSGGGASRQGTKGRRVGSRSRGEPPSTGLRRKGSAPALTLRLLLKQFLLFECTCQRLNHSLQCGCNSSERNSQFALRPSRVYRISKTYLLLSRNTPRSTSRMAAASLTTTDGPVARQSTNVGKADQGPNAYE
jgi:hypothetical protein